MAEPRRLVHVAVFGDQPRSARQLEGCSLPPLSIWVGLEEADDSSLLGALVAQSSQQDLPTKRGRAVVWQRSAHRVGLRWGIDSGGGRIPRPLVRGVRSGVGQVADVHLGERPRHLDW